MKRTSANSPPGMPRDEFGNSTGDDQEYQYNTRNDNSRRKRNRVSFIDSTACLCFLVILFGSLVMFSILFIALADGRSDSIHSSPIMVDANMHGNASMKIIQLPESAERISQTIYRHIVDHPTQKDKKIKIYYHVTHHPNSPEGHRIARTHSFKKGPNKHLHRADVPEPKTVLNLETGKRDISTESCGCYGFIEDWRARLRENRMYYIDSSISMGSGITLGEIESLFHAGASVWNAILANVQAGSSTCSVIGNQTGSGIDLVYSWGTLNEVDEIFSGQIINPPSAIAITQIAVVDDAIIEWNQVYDTQTPWGDASLDSSKIDRLSVITHEWGHACCALEDIPVASCAGTTMGATISVGETYKRDLEPCSDVAALVDLCGAVSGVSIEGDSQVNAPASDAKALMYNVFLILLSVAVLIASN